MCSTPFAFSGHPAPAGSAGGGGQLQAETAPDEQLGFIGQFQIFKGFGQFFVILGHLLKEGIALLSGDGGVHLAFAGEDFKIVSTGENVGTDLVIARVQRLQRNVLDGGGGAGLDVQTAVDFQNVALFQGDIPEAPAAAEESESFDSDDGADDEFGDPDFDVPPPVREKSVRELMDEVKDNPMVQEAIDLFGGRLADVYENN